MSDYISKYLAGTPQATQNVGQETANIGRYFNGQAANELSAQRDQAYRDALAGSDLASRYYLRNASNQSLAAGPGGASSYMTRLGLANLAPIQSQAALARDAAARGDWQSLEQAKLGMTGQRTALADQLAQRSLTPIAASNALYGQQLGQLGQLGQLDTANTFYGLKKHPGIGEGFLSDYGSFMDAY